MWSGGKSPFYIAPLCVIICPSFRISGLLSSLNCSPAIPQFQLESLTGLCSSGRGSLPTGGPHRHHTCHRPSWGAGAGGGGGGVGPPTPTLLQDLQGLQIVSVSARVGGDISHQKHQHWCWEAEGRALPRGKIFS